MAKSNKNFKKPVNNQEIVIDEEDKNKKMIIMVCLAIIIILGLIVASIAYFNSRDIEEDKKGNKDDGNKPTEIVKPEEENKNPVVNKPISSVVTTPVVNKPKEDVAATPTDPKEVTAVIESVDENDYMVTMEGNVAKISGVSRFVTATKDGDFNNAIIIKVTLDGKYSRNDLKNMIVTTTTNGVTTNNFDYVIKEGTKTDPATGINTPELYFEWVQPVGHGYEVPTSFTVKIGEEITTYEIDLNDLKIESEVEDTESSMFVVPLDKPALAGSYPYDIEVYRKLSVDEIQWDLGTTTANLDEELTESNETIDNDLSAINDTTDTTNETIKAPAPTYSDELDYTIKFKMDDITSSEYNSWNKKLVVKVYAPIITDESGNKTVTITPSNIKAEYIGTGKDEVDPNKGTIAIEQDTNQYLEDGTTENPNYNNYYIILSYDTTDDETLDNQKFTIDWDGESNNDYGKTTYEFDLSDLRDKQENAPITTDLNEDIDEEQEMETLEDEQPIEVENLDTPVQPEDSSDSPVEPIQDLAVEELEGTLE